MYKSIIVTYLMSSSSSVFVVDESDRRSIDLIYICLFFFLKQVITQKNVTFNISLEKPHELSSLNETHALQIEPKIKKKFTNLEKLEVKLGKARAAIKEAATFGNQTDDSDYVPSGPMYWNAKAFHRYGSVLLVVEKSSTLLFCPR